MSIYLHTRLFFTLFVLLVALAACDPYMPAYQPSPEFIIVTAPPTATATRTPTPDATATASPQPTALASPTATAFPCAAEGGQVIRFDTFRSEIAGENLRYRVYIPPCYFETELRYPVVYLLHGAGSRESQWEDLGVAQAIDQGVRLGVLAPMIVVMPYWGSIGNQDFFPPDPSYEDVLLTELVPAIERDFCTINDRTHRALGGISRGGFWAYSIGLRHPDVFGILGGHSAFFDADNAPPAFNPLEIALNNTFLPEANLRMYLDNGAADPAGAPIELFSSRLATRGILHTYIINPVGGHDEAYWSAHLSEYLAFYAEGWARSTGDLPSCAAPSP